MIEHKWKQNKVATHRKKKKARGTTEHIVSKQEKYKAHTAHETSHGRDRKMTTDLPERTTAEQHTHQIPRVP